MYNSKNLPLSPKKVIKKTLVRLFRSGLWVIVIFSLILFVKELRFLQYFSVPLLTLIVILFFIIPLMLILIILIYEYLYYKFYFYEFGEDRAVIRKGVISQATGYVRYERLQNIYVDQDFWDRIFGLYDVHFETAGEQSSFYSHVDGLTKENADKLVAFLQEKMEQSVQGPKERKEISQPEATKEEIRISKEGIEEKEISIKDYPLSKSVIITRTISSIIGIAIVIMLVYMIVVSFRYLEEDRVTGPLFSLSSWPVFLMVSVVVSILSLIYNIIWYRNFYFYFGKEKAEIRSKVIGQSISYLYYDRIQNVDIFQGVLGRIFNIYTIKIETAGEFSGTRLVIDGLTKEGAEKIKDFLLAKARHYRDRL